MSANYAKLLYGNCYAAAFNALCSSIRRSHKFQCYALLSICFAPRSIAQATQSDLARRRKLIRKRLSSVDEDIAEAFMQFLDCIKLRFTFEIALHNRVKTYRMLIALLLHCKAI